MRCGRERFRPHTSKSIPMKKTLPLLGFLCFLMFVVNAQITTPQIRANFGVDGDLRSNFFDGFVVNGNDDWFSNTAGTGRFIIDTTGASYILSRYAADPAFRRQPFFRGMRYPQFTTLGNKILIDGIFIRDHHGDDSTVFASGSNKNGMSPGLWSCPVSQGIPDKNDILDIMMHVRRDGLSLSDSLWMFGGVSIENTTGSRYFDFEMYQTDITYNRMTRTFMGFGADAGHTAWQFDAAGNITRPGDIIFTAEFASGGLSLLEARIWIHRDAKLITPANFNWGTEFDGDGNGATYGYANISPKTAGAFYTGLQSSNNTWAGPFALVRQDNSISTNYGARQYMEFSVNLSKLGLDPLVTQNNACGMPFRRIVVKSRASTSFTAELKDFVGPFSFFRAPAAQASADIPFYCGANGVSNICVDSALSTSLYTWHTPNGNIVGDSVGPCITVDQPGRYIVRQQLMDSCGVSYATDTVTITADPLCVVLSQDLSDWKGVYNKGQVLLNWTMNDFGQVAYYEIERSTNKVNFTTVGKVASLYPRQYYKHTDAIGDMAGEYVYYRLKIVTRSGAMQRSRILTIRTNDDPATELAITPNPVRSTMQINIPALAEQEVTIEFIDQTGRIVGAQKKMLSKGTNSISFSDFEKWPNGVYIVRVRTNENRFQGKMILIK
jgi:hypothetical protein